MTQNDYYYDLENAKIIWRSVSGLSHNRVKDNPWKTNTKYILHKRKGTKNNTKHYERKSNTHPVGDALQVDLSHSN